MIRTFSFSSWACLAPWVLALLSIAFGVFCLRRSNAAARVWGWFLVVVGALLGGVVGPSVACDRIIVSDHDITHTTGLWFAPTVKGFEFADVKRVRIRTEAVLNRPGSKRNQVFWYVDTRAGDTQRMGLGDLWSTNSDAIVEVLRARGVEISP